MYLLTIKTLTGNTLTYRVKEYRIENDQVIFIDGRTGLEKRFSTSRVDIEEVREWTLT